MTVNDETGYQAGLEKIWGEKGGAGPEILSGPQIEAKRLYWQLFELSLYFEGIDDRFANAAAALLEHRIVDKHTNFNRNWKDPYRAQDYVAVHAFVEDLMNKEGMSEERACAHVAAYAPVRAASFKAAVKQAKRIYKEVGNLSTPEMSNDS